MKAESLTVFPRTLKKRTGVKKLRAQDRVPAVIYGSKTEAQNLELNLREIEHLYSHAASDILLVELTMDGQSGDAKRLAMLQDVQHHPLSGKILHADLREVARDEEIEISIPIEPTGVAVGVELGGVLDHALQKVRLRGTVIDLPEILTMDVTALNQGDSLHVKNLTVPAGVKVLADPELTIFTVTAPVEEVAETASAEGAEGGEMAEPEVIREKKTSDEDGAEKGGKSK